MVMTAASDTPVVPQCVFKSWKYAKFFTFQEEKNNVITVNCKLYLPLSKSLSAAKESTSNLKKAPSGKITAS